MKKFLITTIIFILLTSTAFSFDNNRVGFVFGGGIGFTPSANIDDDNSSNNLASSSGIGFNLFIGTSIDKQNMIVYEFNQTSYGLNDSTASFSQGFEGVTWYHYFGNSEKNLFSIIGLGIYNFTADGYNSNIFGQGVMLGAGYKFSRHWQIGATLSGGKTNDVVFDYKHSTLNILITGIAF